jgi:hypothetical protein
MGQGPHLIRLIHSSSCQIHLVMFARDEHLRLPSEEVIAARSLLKVPAVHPPIPVDGRRHDEYCEGCSVSIYLYAIW